LSRKWKVVNDLNKLTSQWVGAILVAFNMEG